MTERRKWALTFAFAVIVFAVLLTVKCSVWRECRAAGQSFFYCGSLTR